YTAAEALLARYALEIPLGEGRGVLLGGRNESAARLVELLVRRGDATGALSVMRDARARALVGLARAHRLGALQGDAHRRWNEASASYNELRSAIEDDVAGDWSRSGADLRARRAVRAKEPAAARAVLARALALVDPAPAPAVRAPLADGDVMLAYS